MEAGIRRYVSYGWYYEVHELGYKYHINDIAAAIVIVQLSKIDRANAKRRVIIQHYNNAFRDIDWIEIPVEKDYVRSAHHNYVIKFPHRDELNLYLKDKGIAT
jgi:perosamine synthetase